MDGKVIALITTLINSFAQMGVQVELATDGGQRFTAYDFGEFCKQWGVRQRLSSAHYPQSNGRAEAAVKTAKRLFMDNTERGGRADTPLLGIEFSPGQILFGCQVHQESCCGIYNHGLQ